jgi:Na+-driven multidrug efflux pump
MILLSATLFQAIGKGGIATFLLVARQVIIFAPIVIILPLFMGLDGVWISLPIADIIILIFTSILVFREFGILGQNPSKKQVNIINAGTKD